MRLTSILLLATCLHLSAAIRAQSITLSEQHSPLIRIFQKITEQTGYQFIYRDEWLSQMKESTVSVQNASLKEVLDLCFQDQPFSYEILDKIVVLKERPAASRGIPEPALNPITIRGRVTDSLGSPLPGATVRIRGTSKGTVTDAQGEFELKDISGTSVLVISYTGFITREIAASHAALPGYTVVLHRAQDILDATIIQGYGTTSRRFAVGSIATVDASTIEKQPVTNVLLALEGQVPGLAVNATSGVPGSQVQLQVRGQNTLLTNPQGFKPYDQPLFIIDGVPFASQNANLNLLSSLASAQSSNGGISQGGGISAFNGINPADIESISILKDADATSIYGTQGSNGVILITTKKGKPGKTQLDLTANTGFSSAAHTVKLLNTSQYLQMRNDAFLADSATPSTTSFFGFAPDLVVFDQNKYTDWQKVIYGKTVNTTDIHASLSGGTANTTFLLSGGYTRADYNFPGNFADQRLTMHSNLHHVSADGRMTMDFGVDYSYDQNTSAAFGGGHQILLPPNTPNLLDANGNLIWSYKGVDMTQFQFYSYLKQPVELQDYNLNNTFRLTYKILSGLSFSLNAGYSRNTSSENSKDPASAQNPMYISRSATFAVNNSQTVNVEPQIDYTADIGKGVLSVLAGGTYKKNTNYTLQQQGYGYANDNFLNSINGASTLYSNDSYTLYRYDAVFGRIKYVYDRRYIISLTGRRDGSSNFGPGRQFGNFGSAGAGWIFSETKAIKTTLPFISYAKLSGSYGTSGSDGIAPYNYQAFWQPAGQAPAFQGVQPNTPQNLYNPIYSWALKKSLNIALDLGLLHNRLLVNATYYRDREGNQLGGYPLPQQSGFPSVLENLPALIQNKGWELSFTSTNIKTRTFSWTSNFNITFNRNQLLAYPNLEASSYSLKYMIGKPSSVVMGYRYKDVNPTTGLFEFYDQHGQATSNPVFGLPSAGGDLFPVADREVRYMGGFGNTFSYKQLSLYVFFQFSSQMAPNYLNTVYSSYIPSVSAYNEPLPVLNYWKNPGDHALLQRLGSSYLSNVMNTAGDFTESSGVYSDDTYVRLKTLSLSYAFPEKLIRRMHVRGCRVSLSAQNLLTFTNYKVADPETFDDYTVFPLQRIVSMGLNFNF